MPIQRLPFLLAAGISLASLPAFANNYATNSPGVAQALGEGAPAAASNSHASAAAAARSQSQSRATGGAATANGGAGGSAVVNNNGGGSGGGNGGVAQAISPASLSTANTCAAGISIAGFGTGGGGGGAAQWEMHDCRLRATAVLLDARGDHTAARNVWCQISEVHKAYAQAGEPCPDEDAKAQPVAVVTPVSTTVVVHKNAVPDWCATTSGKDPESDRAHCQQALRTAMAHLRENR